MRAIPSSFLVPDASRWRTLAQEPSRPGVLVLSQYAGAADALTGALITNPFHADVLAADINRALQMSTGERIARQRSLQTALERSGSPAAWARRFLDRLGRRALREVSAPVDVTDRRPKHRHGSDPLHVPPS